MTDEQALPWPSVSVLVPVRNQPRWIEGCYLALKQQDYPRGLVEIIVIDCGSTDGTAELARRWPGSMLCDRPVPLGEAIDAAAARARGEVLALTHPTCVPSQQWLRNLIQPLLTPETDADATQGTTASWQRAPVARFAALEAAQTIEEWTKLEELRSVDCASLAVRRQRWDQAGPSSRLVATLEGYNLDLAWRLDQARARIVLAPHAVAYQRHDETLAAWLARQYQLAHDAGMLMGERGLGVLAHSRQPGNTKIQAGLVMLTLVNLLLLLAASPDFYFYANLTLFLLFLLSAGGQAWYCRRRDPLLLPWLPALLLARATVTALGFLVGWARCAVNRPAG